MSGKRRAHHRTEGVEETSGRGEGLDAPERERLTIFVMSEVERRRQLLTKAKAGDPAAIQVLRQQYHLTINRGAP